MERIELLKARAADRTPDIEAFGRISEQTRRETLGMEEVLCKARFLTRLAGELPTPVNTAERILGSMRFWHNRSAGARSFGNLGHIVVDYGFVLRLGLGALQERILLRDTIDAAASAQSVKALSRLILRYADAADALARETKTESLAHSAAVCRRIAEKPPCSFQEAVQLVWFIHLFLHAEGMAAAVSFGRLDMILYPYYAADLKKGTLTRAEAKELLACLWLKTCEGDESQNLILGGPGENELSLLCLEVTRELCVHQPSISVRIGEETSDAFMHEVAALIRAGLGMPAMFNDRVVCKALTALGIPGEEARDYSIVGCYEANPPQSLGLTVAGGMNLHEILLEWIPQGKCDDFDGCVESFKAFFTRRYQEKLLPEYKAHWTRIQDQCASPFESACIPACVESGLAAEHKGAKHTMFGVNILGLGTLTDSLYAIRKIVYEGGMDYDSFTEQVAAGFPDRSLSERCKKLPGKYGTDTPETNALARELSEHIARTVIRSRFDPDVIVYPGFFRFTADIYAERNAWPATPDGRLAGEKLSYGVSASDYAVGKSATSILCSASHASNDLCACGNPVMLCLAPEATAGESGEQVLLSLIRGFFDRGGFHLQINVADADTLRAAQKTPEAYRDLMIRISGYSARFVTLDRTMQDALIARAKN